MNAREFLSNCNNSELREKLVYLDTMMMLFHQSGKYATLPLSELEILNNGITMESFKNKYNYLPSQDSDEIGYNANGDLEDIKELCLLGICAYNHLNFDYNRNMSIMNSFQNEHFLEPYLNNSRANMPQDIRNYYRDVLVHNKKIYLNQYLKQELSSGEEKGKRLAKHLPGFSDVDESAYVNVLVIPAVLTLVYLLVVAVYYIFLK